MRTRTKLKDPKREIQLFTKRTAVISFFIGVLSLVLISGLINLQIAQHSTYRTLSQRNQLNVLPIVPKRGLIYDRHGVLLAENLPIFSLEIIPNKVSDLKKTLEELTPLLSITDDEKLAFLKQVKQRRRFDAIPLRTRLSEEDVARFAVNQQRFPGVMVKAELIRHYPLGATFVPIIGYIGRINAKEVTQVDPINYSGTNYIGKIGIEKFYEKVLHGKVGYEQVEIDAAGRKVRVLKRTPSIAGSNLYLTIDSRLQQAAQAAMGTRPGAVVAIEPATGAILAFVSNPSYDPNAFVTGIRSADYQRLQQDPDLPLYNRALRGQYPPGSIIKPFLALGGIALNVISADHSLFCSGWFQLRNSSHIYHDWWRSGHGSVNLTSAVARSCDVYFFQLAVKMGIERMHYILQKFGLGKQTGIDSQEELSGLLPTPDWKKRARKQSWYPGDTVSASIGQGYMLTTPLQMASATATLANRGRGMQPTFLLGQQKSLPPLVLEKEQWDVVIQAMEKVISEGTGGKYYGKDAKYTVAGKTGTAQVFSLKGQKYDASKLAKRLHDHSWFIAFAPVEKPAIALAIILENDTGAGTVARQVIDAYLVPPPVQTKENKI